MQPNIIPNLPRQQRMLLGRIIPDQQNRRRVKYIAHAGGGFRFSRKRRGKSREVGRPVMVDVVGLQNHARELLQQIILFVSRAVGAHDANGRAAVLIANFLESSFRPVQTLLPM